MNHKHTHIPFKEQFLKKNFKADFFLFRPPSRHKTPPKGNLIHTAIGLDLPKNPNTIEEDLTPSNDIQNTNNDFTDLFVNKRESEGKLAPLKAWHDDHKLTVSNNYLAANMVDRPGTVSKAKAISPVKALPLDFPKPSTACGAKKVNAQKEPSEAAFIIK